MSYFNRAVATNNRIIGASISGSNHKIAWVEVWLGQLDIVQDKGFQLHLFISISCTRCAYVEIQRLLVPVPTYCTILVRPGSRSRFHQENLYVVVEEEVAKPVLLDGLCGREQAKKKTNLCM